MDTDRGDQVPVSLKSALTLDEEGKNITIRIKFKCVEHKGDGTTISGTKTYPVYTAPKGATIVGFEPKGGPIANFSTDSVNEQHGWQSFNKSRINRSFFTSLTYRIDRDGGNDHDIAGTKGRIDFPVILQRPNPEYEKWQNDQAAKAASAPNAQSM